jgi:hypothetical protein
MNRPHALMLLSECTGDDIWSLELCKERRIPIAWIEEMKDAYESGFRSDQSTIYYQGEVVNQFEGVRDVDLACKLGEYLGLKVKQIVASCWSRASVVRALQEAMEED